MPLPRHLNSAPIVEGIIDIQVKVPGLLQLVRLRQLAAKFDLAAKIEEVRTVAVQIIQVAGAQPSQKVQTSDPIGIRCTSTDGKVVVQFRKNGFTFSRLAPYSSWEEIFPQASAIYREYVETVAPEQITRIAVRNINRLLLPSAKLSENPSLFFTTPPSPPKSDNAMVDHWMTRFRLVRLDPKRQALVTLLTEDEREGDRQPVILDVDVFDNGILPLDTEQLLLRLNPLRDWKNELFFNVLTEEALALYE